MSSKGRPYRVVIEAGFEILVGRGDAENDRLTFREADGADFWMHVAGVPGSHVVVRNPDRVEELPQGVAERAAALAAWYSQARGRKGKVDVHVCRVADVSKPRGFAPGEVRLARFKVLKVYPKAGTPPPEES
jgi:predicted ribosome quality control (RQC) complex YloA/Tae2 family protein